jgi:hypothetical protein
LSLIANRDQDWVSTTPIGQGTPWSIIFITLVASPKRSRTEWHAQTVGRPGY